MTSFLTRLFGRTRGTHRIRGIPVEIVNTRADIDSDAVLQRLDEALALVERYQPVRFVHLRRDIDAIRIIRFPTRGAYLPSENVVITELTFLARRDITAAPVASSILHEGVHARVAHFSHRVLGGRVTDRGMAKEERLCRRAELTFGQTLPASLGAPVIERAVATLSMDDTNVAPDVDWTLAAQRVREVDRGA